MEYRKGLNYLKVFHCHGCQSCLYEDHKTGEIKQRQHLLSVEQATNEVEALYKDLNNLAEKVQKFSKTETVFNERVAFLREIKELKKENSALTEELAKAKEYIGMAFHPESGWAINPDSEYYKRLIKKSDAFLELKSIFNTLYSIFNRTNNV